MLLYIHAFDDISPAQVRLRYAVFLRHHADGQLRRLMRFRRRLLFTPTLMSLSHDAMPCRDILLPLPPAGLTPRYYAICRRHFAIRIASRHATISARRCRRRHAMMLLLLPLLMLLIAALLILITAFAATRYHSISKIRGAARRRARCAEAAKARRAAICVC